MPNSQYQTHYESQVKPRLNNVRDLANRISKGLELLTSTETIDLAAREKLPETDPLHHFYFSQAEKWHYTPSFCACQLKY